MKRQHHWLRRVETVLAARTFWWFVLGLLVAQATWIALSGRYPMAFDEDFHLGIIRLYAHHLSPFLSGQPAHADQFGAVARDPSYLYHYLMSFPYRLIAQLTGDQTLQVLVLRAINIGLLTGGVVLYRRVLLRMGTSRELAHLCLLIFVLIPVVPLLAAQINYDNLLLPLVAIILLLGFRFEEHLARERRIDLAALLLLAGLAMLTSLVKYAFLPIFAAVGMFVAVRLWQRRRTLPAPWLGLPAAWRQLSRWAQLGCIILLVAASGLFVERYGVNLVRYHTPVPDCGQVLTVEQCSHYGPWIRDYNYKLNTLDTDAVHSPLTFAADWFYGMWLRLFFAVDGPATQFQTRGPLLLPGLAGIAFAVGGVLAVMAALPKLWRKHRRGAPRVWLTAAAVICYVAALWLDNYRAYVETGQPVAINGRYLVPVLLPVLVLAARAVDELLGRRQAQKLAIGLTAVVCLAWGGGALTYILRSNNAWYWPNSTIRTANHAVQNVLGPLTPGYRHPTEFMH